MNIGYFGTPDYSAKLLKEIYKKHNIICVISNPDSISDRTKKLKPSPVSQFAIENNIPLFRPENLKDHQFLKEIKKISENIELFLVFSYGKILPKEIIEIPKLKTINLHGSLLPDLRGASPLQTAILKGYKKSGWTLQKVSLKMDEGDILDQVEFEIFPNETYGELLERVLPLGIQLTLKVLDNLEFYLQNAKEQDHNKATYCTKIISDTIHIDWSKTKEEIHNFIRALNPNPIAKTRLKKQDKTIENIKIYKTLLTEISNFKELPNGYCKIEKFDKKNHLYVKTKNSFLEILEIQFPNKKKINANDCINGNFIKEGDIFL